MKRTKIVALSAVLVVAVVGLLWHNKAQMQAKAKSEVTTAFPVSVEKVSKRDISETLSLVGTIVANNDVAVVSETQGRIVAINASVGDRKNAGDILVRVDDELKRAEFMKAEVSYERAKKDADRFSSLRDEQAVTEWQKENAWQGSKIAEAEYIRARKAYRDTKISSPIAGVVTARGVDVGTMVQPGMVVANVVDISKLKVKLNVPEEDAFKLKAGDPVEVTTDVYPGIKFAGKVTSISSKGDASHNYPVEIALPNSKENPLRAGMFGRVTIKTASASGALVVSKEAILNSDTKPMVFMADNGIARARVVKLGVRSENVIQILEGLKEGESVVSFGQGKLKDGMPIQYAQ
jgi:RND family efflux transporter MFP subunit